MDEEITDERKGLSSRTKPSRLLREIGTTSYAQNQVNTLRRQVKLTKQDGQEPQDLSNVKEPLFREKLRDAYFKLEGEVVLKCWAIGTPAPSYTWFRNDTILIESSRVQVKRLTGEESGSGGCELRIKLAKEYDAGIYKCIARNSAGSVVCRCKLSFGDIPSAVHNLSLLDASGSSLLIAWSLPRFTGANSIDSYQVEVKQPDQSEWQVVDTKIKQEYTIINNLPPNSVHQIRVSARNQFGLGEPSYVLEAKTLDSNQSKTISLPATMQFVCNSSQDQTTALDYTREAGNPVQLIKSEFKDLYDFKSIIFKGKFSVVAQAYIKDGSRSVLATKAVLAQSEQESLISNEFEILKSLSHERIVQLRYANRDGNIFSLTMEMLSGLNVLTFLSRRSCYTEQCVARIICQVLDAIEYLNYRNIALIELAPDNVLMVDERKFDIKLTDFGAAQSGIGNGGVKVTTLANPEYIGQSRMSILIGEW